MEKTYEIRKNYRDNEGLRKSFNELANQTFGINFENWYQNGFWKDNYNPYSVVVDGEVVANVSVNKCDMEWKGEILHLVQLGTVMTKPEFRGNGLSAVLMNEIMKEYEDCTDGMFLFANDTVLDFYPKFGFVKKTDYKCRKDVVISKEKTAVQVPMNNHEDWNRFIKIIESSVQAGKLNMIGNTDLFMFYLSQYMMECVYYIPEQEAYAVAEAEDGELTLYNVFSKKQANLDNIIEAFGKEITSVGLGFTPRNTEGFIEEEYLEKDTTTFVKGKFAEGILSTPCVFPELCHA